MKNKGGLYYKEQINVKRLNSAFCFIERLEYRPLEREAGHVYVTNDSEIIKVTWLIIKHFYLNTPKEWKNSL